MKNSQQQLLWRVMAMKISQLQPQWRLAAKDVSKIWRQNREKSGAAAEKHQQAVHQPWRENVKIRRNVWLAISAKKSMA